MSRVANSPVEIPSGVETKISDAEVSVKGSKGNLQLALHSQVTVAQDDGVLKVSAKDNSRQADALAGTFRSLINNMVVGVTDGYSKQLNIVGVGYKVALKGKDLVLNLGHSHAIDYPAPAGIEFDVDGKKNTIVVKGVNKEVVGQTAAEIRGFRPPEPYKGKGVMYSTERIRRKAGKAAVGKG